MRLSQALELVSARYVPGVVSHYAKQSPDPWQQAHDDLERIAGIMDEATATPVLERFVERCTDLIGRYLAEKDPTKAATPADHFAGGEDRIRAHMSRKLKQCFYCDSKDALKIMPLEPGSIEVILACRECATEMSA